MLFSEIGSDDKVKCLELIIGKIPNSLKITKTGPRRFHDCCRLCLELIIKNKYLYNCKNCKILRNYNQFLNGINEIRSCKV